MKSGTDAVVDLVNETLERLYEALEPKELTLALSCLVEEIRLSNENGNLAHLSRLLSVLIYAVRFKKGANVFGKFFCCFFIVGFINVDGNLHLCRLYASA